MATDPPPADHRRLAVSILVIVGGLVAMAAMLALVVIGGTVEATGGPADGDTPRTRTATAAPAPLTDGYRVWARNDDGLPVRWDPCRAIELVVDDTGAPVGFRADLDRAIAQLEAASGLKLRVVGRTDERPSDGRPAYQPARWGERWAPVLVAWAEPHEGGLPLGPHDRGVAIPVAVGVSGDRTYVTGQVVFNRERTDLRAGDADRARSWGATILHELAHLVGLGHVEDADELMYTYPGSGPVEFGPGDRAGLRALGADAGCRARPTPGPVAVAERSSAGP
jgi:hypothetical protein